VTPPTCWMRRHSWKRRGKRTHEVHEDHLELGEAASLLYIYI
jgi:hypothetical protein